MPRIIGYGFFTSVILATFDYTGNSLRGYGRNPEVDEFDRREQLRLNRRRPIEETLAELGEGRGGGESTRSQSPLQLSHPFSG